MPATPLIDPSGGYIMPQQTVYIREVDMEKWKSLKKKSEFIHNALKGNALDAYKEAGGDPEFIIASKKDIESQFGTKEAKPITYKKTQNWGA